MRSDRAPQGENRRPQSAGWTCAHAEDAVQDALDARQPRVAWDPWLLAHLVGCSACREETSELLDLDRVARAAGRELGLWNPDLCDATRRATAPLDGARAPTAAALPGADLGQRPVLVHGPGRAVAAIVCGLFVWFGALPVLRWGCVGSPIDASPAARSVKVASFHRSRDTLRATLLRRRRVLRELRS